MKATYSIIAAIAITLTTASGTWAIAAPVLPIPAFTAFKNSYPPVNAIPPTNSPQVVAWLAALDLTKVPNIPVVAWNEVAGAPTNANAVPADACDWTVNNCINNDIVTCPVGQWGLTYDDGPTQFSPALYDFLDTTNQKATLFYIGSQIQQYPQYAQRACAAGHQIAVHTWSHHASTSLTNEQFVAEIKWTEAIIQDVCGLTPYYFRPPYGDIDNRIRGLLTQMGYKSVIWDIDTDDWNMPPKTEAQVDADFAGWIKAAGNLTTGHICLEHELSNDSVTAAIKNLPAVQATWKTMPVSACLNDAHPYREANITLATANSTAAGISNSTSSSTAASSTSSSAGASTTGSSNSKGGSGTTASGAVMEKMPQMVMSAFVAATIVAVGLVGF